MGVRRERGRIATALLVASIATITLASTAAHADEKVDSDRSEELAAQAFDQYKKKEYTLAIATYQRAYQAAPAAAILFNIANIYDKKLRDREHAAEYYARCLKAPDADAELAKRASDRLATIKSELKAEAKASAAKEARSDEPEAAAAPAPAVTPATTTTPPSVDTDPPRPLRPVGAGVAAAGLVSVGLGVVFGLVATGKNDDAAASCAGGECTDPRAPELTREAHTFATASTVAFAVGAVGLVTGGLLWFWPAPDASTRRARDGEPRKRNVALHAVPHMTPGGGGLVLEGVLP